MQKRGVALALAALMVWTLALPAFAQVNPFSDLRSDHWAYEAVVSLAAAGLVEGYPDGTFGGDRNFTRYEMAMVFARILARFENLIDRKIADGIEARTGDLEQLIRQTREELAAAIQSNHEELSAKIGSLADRVSALEADTAAVDRSPSVEYVPEAQAALTDAAIEELMNRLRNLATKDDVAELAERVAAGAARVADHFDLFDGRLNNLERRVDGLEVRTDEIARVLGALRDGMLTEDDARTIAELAIADALARRDREITAALSAAQGDTNALLEVIQNRVTDLGDQIDRLNSEFRQELAHLKELGLKVADLDERIKRQEETTAQLAGQVAQNREDIDSLLRLADRIRVSGKSETTFVRTRVQGAVADALKDPRDKDSEKWTPEDRFDSKVILGINANPADNVDIRAELVLNDVFGGIDEVKPGVNLEVTTPGVLRMLRLGDLDEKHIAASFDKYTFDAERVEDLFDGKEPSYTFEGPFQGADVHLVFGHEDSTEVDAFISRKTPGDLIAGVAASYELSPEIGLTFRGVRDVYTPGVPGTVVGVTVDGELPSVSADYSLTYVTNAEAGYGNVVDTWAEFPLRLANVRLQYASVDENFASTYGKKLDSVDNDWLVRRLDPSADLVAYGESDLAATFTRPVLGVDVALTVGSRTDVDPAAVNDNNRYTQVEVGPFHYAGLDASLLYDRRINDADAGDNTLRATVDTTIWGAAVSATMHNRTNDQVATIAPNEVDQRSVWITASRDFDFVVPLTVDARLALNQALSRRSGKLAVSTERAFGDVLLRAGYSHERNALGGIMDDDEDIAKKWWQNAAWSGPHKLDTMTLGAEYTLKGIFGTDIDTGYEYKLVRVNDAIHGTARNTITVGFEKELRGGEAILSGQGKYVTGGIPEEFADAGNDADLSAKLTLTYPVFAGGNLKVGGEYVSSTGNKNPEYSVFNVNAGLTIEF